MIDYISSIPYFDYLLSNELINTYERQPAVSFIYDALLLITTVCTFIFFYILLSEKKLQKKLFERYFLITEFFTNFSITLGVIGTLYSISNEVSLSGEVNLSQVISNNFDAAVVTTIIGGLCYGYCSMLQAILSWRVQPHEEN